jgi:DNA-binding XRE family transcriptional regulator
MKAVKRKRLESDGWIVGDVKTFLGLSDAESEFIEMKLALAENLKQRRIQRGMTQKDLAEQLSSSQSRVAKIEGGDESVSLDLLVRSLLTVGLTRREIAKVIAGKPRRRAAS